jgi:hypothetical protein
MTGHRKQSFGRAIFRFRPPVSERNCLPMTPKTIVLGTDMRALEPNATVISSLLAPHRGEGMGADIQP